MSIKRICKNCKNGRILKKDNCFEDEKCPVCNGKGYRWFESKPRYITSHDPASGKDKTVKIELDVVNNIVVQVLEN